MTYQLKMTPEINDREARSNALQARGARYVTESDMLTPDGLLLGAHPNDLCGQVVGILDVEGDNDHLIETTRAVSVEVCNCNGLTFRMALALYRAA